MPDLQNLHLTILKDRGLTAGEIEEFLNPEYNEEKGGMYDVSRMKDIDKATTRIWQAIEKNEKICIYADYDADGVPGAVVLYEFFRKIAYEKNIVVKIPHRHSDGFGLHKHLIDEIQKEGSTLIITIDLGISNVKEVAYANTLGIHVIITDHHLPHDVLPDAYAILNPKQVDCNYLEKMLCGSGVMYKLVHRLVSQARTRGYKIHAGWEKWLLDLVGLATISDMVPLTGENRVFAHFGLKILQKNSRSGFSALMQELKIYSQNIQEDDIGFSISPCLNAASRMSHAYDAFILLASVNIVDATTHAKKLTSLNVDRKAKAKTLVEAAEKKVLEKDVEQGILIVGDADWSPTLMGPVCSGLVRKYTVPVFAYGCEEGEVFRGSCRSIPGVSVVEIMSYMPDDFFVEHGGHAASGGFAFTKEKEKYFKKELQKAYKIWKENQMKDSEDFEGVEKKETEKIYTITHDSIDGNLLHGLNQLKPYGMGNAKPYFCVTSIEFREIKSFGKEKEHVEFLIDTYVDIQGNTQNVTPDFLKDAYKYSSIHEKVSPLRYITFFADETLRDIDVTQRYHIYGYIETSFFLGKKEIRFRVEKVEKVEKVDDIL